MTSAKSPVPEAELDIDVLLVTGLLARQFPDVAHLRVTLAGNGWDNTMFRLGDRLAVRLPRRQIAADISATELDWLPQLASSWTFAAPVPVHIGASQGAYPWRWSIVPWLEGTPVISQPLDARGAADLGEALAQVHALAHVGAPRNPFRSAPLRDRLERFALRLASLTSDPGWGIDADAALALVERAAGNDARVETWCHLDLHGRNVLGADGRLAGIIDWGDAAVADAHTDLGQARYLVGSELFEHTARAYAQAGGAGDPWGAATQAECVLYAVTMASIDDRAFSASGWLRLADLGLARPAHEDRGAVRRTTSARRVARRPRTSPRRR